MCLAALDPRKRELMFRRRDNRQWDQLRPIKFTRNFTKNADGSVLVEFGDTKVFTTAKIEERVPAFLMGKGEGWITAEYSLLPGSTLVRSPREVTRGQPSGRTNEIQRLIGRCLRAVVDRRALGERTITIDCDVLQADAGTRVAAISAGFLALYDALAKLRKSGHMEDLPLTEHMAAVSVCQINGQLLLDPNYHEDSQAEMDSNIVLTESGKVLELQMTAETKPVEASQIAELMALAEKGVREVIAIQHQALKQR
jgi:ribonuclease PH